MEIFIIKVSDNLYLTEDNTNFFSNDLSKDQRWTKRDEPDQIITRWNIKKTIDGGTIIQGVSLSGNCKVLCLKEN